MATYRSMTISSHSLKHTEDQERDSESLGAASGSDCEKISTESFQCFKMSSSRWHSDKETWYRLLIEKKSHWHVMMIMCPCVANHDAASEPHNRQNNQRTPAVVADDQSGRRELKRLRGLRASAHKAQ